MGWYKDKKGSWRYCENPMHNHCYSSEGAGPSAGWAIAWLIVAVLSIPTVFGPFIFGYLFFSEINKKKDPTRPKEPGTPSGWCK